MTSDLKRAGKLFRYEKMARSAILVYNPNLDCTLVPQFSDHDTTTIQLENQNTYICSSYHDITAAAWPTILNDLANFCRSKNARLIIGADTNAHSEMWGSPAPNGRGEEIEMALIQHGLFVHNIGDVPTFTGTGYTHIDVTMSNIPNNITEWHVSDEPSHSDHRIIEFLLHDVVQHSTLPKRSIKKVNWNKVAQDITAAVPAEIPTQWSAEMLDQHVTSLNNALRASLDIHAPRKGPAKKYTIWWDENCTRTKQAARTAERRMRRHPTSQHKRLLQEASAAYKKAIHDAKRDSWRKFIKEVDSVPDMARVNKILNKVHGPAVELGLVKDGQGQLAQSKQESLQLMLREHFPESTPVNAGEGDTAGSECKPLLDLPWLTRARFRTAVNEFKRGKAPGPDEVRAECLQAISDNTIEYILAMYKASITLAYVPQAWREVEVIFIPKPGKKDYTDTRAFRPISLMSVLFKTLERLTLWHIEEGNLSTMPIHRNQFGFRKGKSTDHALSKAVNIIEKGLYQGQYVLGVFCDISGAFDNVHLHSITASMRRRGVDESIINWYDHFLKCRTITSTLGSSTASMRPGKGAPQGGVLSAIIAWNLVFDDFLELFDNTAITAIGFADDGTLLIVGIDIPTMYDVMQRGLDHAQAWAEDNGLRFCPKKTNAILFTNKRIKYDKLPHLTMYGESVPNVKETKMLGVVLDHKLSWKPHINQRISACKSALVRLRPVLGRIWSPQPKYTRWLYDGVILPMLTYGAAVWATAAATSANKKRLGTLQRLGLTSISTVRKGTPTAALEIIYNVPPLHLLIHERASATLLRLGTMQDTTWQPIGTLKRGHLQELRRDMPLDLSDDVLPIPIPNRDQPYTTLIQPGAEPRSSGVQVYTDGSLMANRSGSGAFIKTDQYQVTLRERLSTCTVFQSELYAIQMACEFLFTQGTDSQHINIHVDSQAALHAISSPYITSKAAEDTIKLLTYLSSNNSVHLQWVKAHVGTEGNEQADAAAKAGSRVSDEYIHKVFAETRTTHKNLIRSRRNAAWAKAWHSSSDCRQSKDFLQGPQPEIWQDLKKVPAPILSRTIRFITGHCFMRRHETLLLHGYTGLNDRPEILCSLCEEEEETPRHLITECPVMITTRLSTLFTWQLDRPPPWSKNIIDFIKSPLIIDLETNPETGM